MSGVLNDLLIYEILSVVSEIPEGRVASYGQIADLIGRSKNARLVGKVLSQSGRTAPSFPLQRVLLEQEGVEFKPNGCVDMKRFQWDCE